MITRRGLFAGLLALPGIGTQGKRYVKKGQIVSIGDYVPDPPVIFYLTADGEMDPDGEAAWRRASAEAMKRKR